MYNASATTRWFGVLAIGLIIKVFPYTPEAGAFETLNGLDWPADTATMSLNLGSPWDTEAEDALFRWNDLPGHTFMFFFDNVDHDHCDFGFDNAVEWDDFSDGVCGITPASSAIAVTFLSAAGMNITNADVVFDLDRTWSEGPRQCTLAEPFHFRSVAVHEFGHALGLAHEDAELARMNTLYHPSPPLMHGDDWAGVRALYDAPGEVVNVFPSHWKKTSPSASQSAVTTTISPTTVRAGENVTFEWTHENGGTSRADFNIGFFLSTDNIISPADTPLGRNTGAFVTAGFAVTFSRTLTIPLGTPGGTYFVGNIVDDDDLLVETSETDNAFVPCQPITVVECTTSSHCDDGILCNGSEICVANRCRPGPNAPLSTPCERDGDLCTTDHCDGHGRCVLESAVSCQVGAGAGVELCQLLDGSGSISSTGFQLQLEGVARAIEDPAIVPQDSSVTILVVQFSSSTRVEVGPVVIDSQATANAAAAQVRAITQLGGGTRIDLGIDACVANLPRSADKSQSIDVSTDGVSDGDPSGAADRAVMAGIDVINALGIGSFNQTQLGTFVRPQPASMFPEDGFVVLVPGFSEFVDAVRQKIRVEVGGTQCEGGERCNPATGGCEPRPDPPLSTPCEADGDLCTIDHCDGHGRCVLESTVSCQAPNPPCEAGEECNPATGACRPLPDVPDGTACDDGIGCTAGDVCHAGACSGTPDDTLCADDGNPCTDHVCGPGGDGITFSYEAFANTTGMFPGFVGPFQLGITNVEGSGSLKANGEPISSSITDADDLRDRFTPPGHRVTAEVVRLVSLSQMGSRTELTLEVRVVAANQPAICSVGKMGTVTLIDDDSLLPNGQTRDFVGYNLGGGSCDTHVHGFNNENVDWTTPPFGGRPDGGHWADVTITTGCETRNNAAACDDGMACTTGDVCRAGACSGIPRDTLCDDNNVCTDDACDASSGTCVNTPNAAPCDSGLPGTVVSQCHRGVCVGTFVQVLQAPCDEEPLPNKLQKVIRKKVGRSEKSLQKADKAADKGKERKVDKFRLRATEQLQVIPRKANKSEISDDCKGTIEQRVEERTFVIQQFAF